MTSPLVAIGAVAIGGALGASARYGIALFLTPNTLTWPLATVLANVLGCSLLGALWQTSWLTSGADSTARLLLVVGFCGGFTTLSAFVFDLDQLVRAGRTLAAAAYLAVTLGGSMLGFLLGGAVIRWFAR